MDGIVGTKKVAQIGLIVADIEVTKQKWAEFLGVEVPPTEEIGDAEVIQTIYKGERNPEASCKLVFFRIDNIEIELIQPNQISSTWRDFLNEKGEGLHHIAFQVADETISLKCADFGAPVIQQGIYGDKSGQYKYLDSTKDLKCIIELLQNF